MALTLHGNNGLGTTNGTAAAPSLAAPDSDTGFYFGTNLIHATTGGTERLRITGDGPHLLLGGTSDVNEITEGASNAGIVIGNTSTYGNAGIAIITTNTGTGRIYFGDGVTNSADRGRGQICYYHNDGSNSDYMRFVTAGGERLRITSGGQVNIGGNYTQTDNALDVTGKIKSSERFNLNNAVYLWQQNRMSLGNSFIIESQQNTPFAICTQGVAQPIVFGTGTAGGAAVEHMRIHSDGDITIGNDPAGSNSWWGDLVVANTTGAAITVGDTGSGERFTFAANGDCNIYSYRNDDNIRFNVTTGGTTSEALRITSAGKIGIGCDPDYTLDVRAASGDVWVSARGGTNQGFQVRKADNTLIGYYGNGGGVGFGVNDNAVSAPAGNLIFQTGGTSSSNERLRIDSSGRLGLGTTNPDTLFHIKNTSASPLQRFESTSYSSYLGTIQANNNLNNGSLAGDLALRGQTGISMSANNGTATQLRIDSSGRVGVGQAPNTKFNVTLAAQQADGTDDASDWGAGGIFQLDATGSAANGNEILFAGAHSGGVGQIASGIGFGRENTGNWGTYLSFKTHSTSTSNIDELNEAVRITSGGNILGKLIHGQLSLTSGTSGSGKNWSSYIQSAYGGITNSVVTSYNDLLIGQNIRGHLACLDGSSTNSYYHWVTHSSMGYAGIEFKYGGLTRFYNWSGSTTANATFTPTVTIGIDNQGDHWGGENPDSTMWDATNQNGWYYRRAQGSFAIATKSSVGYSNIYLNKNTGGGTSDNRWLQFSWDATTIGSITRNSNNTVNYGGTSDYRLKKDDVEIADGITRVKQLRPIKFKWKSNNIDDEGFFAHETQSIVPYAVTGTKDQVITDEEVAAGTARDGKPAGTPIYQNIDYGQLTPILTAALKEAIAKIEVLEAKVAALEGS